MLDNRTILAVTILTIFFICLSSFWSYLKLKNRLLLRVFHTNLLFLLAMFSLIFQGANIPLITIFLANTLIIVFLSASVYITLSLYYKNQNIYFYLIVVLFHLAAFFYFTFVHFNTNARIVCGAIEMASLLIYAFLRILIYPASKKDQCRIFYLILCSSIALIVLLRALFSLLNEKNLISIFNNDIYTAILFMASLTFILLWNRLIVFHVTLEYQKQLQEKIDLLQTTSQDISILHDFYNHLDSDNTENIYKEIFAILKKRFQFPIIGLYKMDKNQGKLRIIHQSGMSAKFLHAAGIIDIKNTASGKAVSQKNFNFTRIEDYPSNKIKDVLIEIGVQSILSSPIIFNNIIFGTITCAFKEKINLNEEEIELFLSICNQFGIILHNYQLYHQLRESEQNYFRIFDLAGDPIFIHDANGLFLNVNNTACQKYGYSRKEFLKMTPRELILPDDGAMIEDRIKFVFSKGSNSFETIHRKKNKQSFPVWINSTIIDYQGEKAVLSHVRDITSQKEMEFKLKEMAFTDPLTGIYNRREFNRLAEIELEYCRRYHVPFTIFMIDLDDFKLINDSYGHHAGDRVLQNISSEVLASIRKTDIFARYGGEEFIGLFNRVSLAEIDKLAQKLLQRVRKLEHSVSSDTTIQVTFSMGIICVENLEERNLKDIIKEADQALYQAKTEGKNDYRIFQ